MEKEPCGVVLEIEINDRCTLAALGKLKNTCLYRQRIPKQHVLCMHLHLPPAQMYILK